MRYLAPILIGCLGAAVLFGLGVWQLQRLDEKLEILAEIEARIAADPVPLPAEPDPEADRFLPVMAEGQFGEEELDVLTSQPPEGAGYRVIAPFETGDGRRILVDRGFIAEEDKGAARPGGETVSLTGNLHWPDETDGFTPEPDEDRGIWFARDVAAMAAELGTEETFVILREPAGTGAPRPIPVGTQGIPNNHLGYAVQWFGLGIVWLGMTALWLWRIRRRTD
ncbi:SURF1 family protein [Roseicyclus sp. F158]|uniref:SURF1-like protein n=1 Tax=Tropicimonas omnivorans TaxID=3075590 RepID=A0ABU3DF95_9RHOB|nr:SURF1 family protein [Roseicyclus sp. F158]MDT0682385.1 SURF1 family protein [Roseicyclus sp. F158]